MSSMKVVAAYEVWSSSYDLDRNLTRDLDEQISRLILGDRRRRSILELGCGTGKNTHWLSQIGACVWAIDFSLAMIERARKKAAFDNVIFTVADVSRSWPIKTGSIGLISCNLVLEHISDVHHVSDFIEAAESAGLSLQKLAEWWHAEDDGKPPRLISFIFRKDN